MYKGHDHASIAMGESSVTEGSVDVDEIKQYRDVWWVTPLVVEDLQYMDAWWVTPLVVEDLRI